MDLDRLKHSISVGRKMMEIGRGKDLTGLELKKLFLLGHNHDIGYKLMYLDILNQADMQIDKYGNDVGYEKS